MHEKSFRNKKLKQFRSQKTPRTTCRRCSPPSYPIRPASEYRSQAIGGFNQHPNSTQES